jgi:hypothetical protein
VHERRGSDRLMHDVSMWPVGRTGIVRWKRTESQDILLERFLTCAVMTKTLVFKTKKKRNGDECKADDEYEFKWGFATPIIFIFDLRRNVPYFYDTFWVKKITPVAKLNVIPDAPWW